MKIAGKVPGINRGTIEFHRPGGQVFRLLVQAVPYGFPERLEREIPAPDPPVEFARDPKSGAVLRDEFGMALKVEKRSDPNWQREMGRVRALRVVLQAREALRGDPSVTFDAESGQKVTGRAYAERVEKEFAEAGFTDSEIIALFNRSLDLNRGAAQRVDEAAERFLSATPSASRGGSPSAPAEASSTLPGAPASGSAGRRTGSSISRANGKRNCWRMSVCASRKIRAVRSQFSSFGIRHF